MVGSDPTLSFCPVFRYAYEGVAAVYYLPAALLAADERDTLRDFLEHSLTGAALVDESVLAGMTTFWDVWGKWRTDDGHCHDTLDTWLLVVRGLTALVEEDTEASRAALRGWLPPPAELLRIAEYETAWRGHVCGLAHPALLLSLLRGERLGDWGAVVEVAEGVLTIEAFNCTVRAEACRLLGRAYHALGGRVAACEAAEKAVAEAARAKYAWLEMMALRDLLSWCEAAEAEAVRSRLRGVTAQLAVSEEDLIEVLRKGEKMHTSPQTRLERSASRWAGCCAVSLTETTSTPCSQSDRPSGSSTTLSGRRVVSV